MPAEAEEAIKTKVKPKEWKDLDEKQREVIKSAYQKADGTIDEEEWKFAQEGIQTINADLELRETPNDVMNGIPYSEAYLYNRRKAINYSPPRNPDDDREVSLGIVHEKIVSFCAVFLKYVWKRRVKSYTKKGRLIKGLGDVFDLAVEHSYRLEKLMKSLLLIFWEVFTQGNAFVLEEWQVRLTPKVKAFMKDPKTGARVEVNPDNMDYTYEFLEGLEYEKGDPVQTRMAKSVLLDGRNVIFGDPEIEEVQDQPRLTLEFSMPRTLGQQVFGSLKRWASVPTDYQTINNVTGDNMTLFNTKRLKDPSETLIVHYSFDKFKNRYNIWCNGIMMLPRQTPMEIYYPRMNYPLSNVAGERLKGSIYARSVPAKTKFNADMADWVFKVLADKFEQGAYPAILSNGKYTLTRKMFRGGQVTHGVKKDDYDKADPDNKGITASEFSFATLLKQTLETQTANPTTSGELEQDATATAVSLTENAQREKLGYLLDGLTIGMMDMAERRIETIESKYTTKERKTIVDGKEVSVYQNFTVQAYGAENHIVMDENVGTEGYDAQEAKDKLFTLSFQDGKQRGLNTKYFMANPEFIKAREYETCVEIMPERRKDTALQMIQFFDELGKVTTLFRGMVNMDKAKEEYLEISGRPEDLFNNKDQEMLAKEEAAQAAMGQEPGQPPAAPRPAKAPAATSQMLSGQR